MSFLTKPFEKAALWWVRRKIKKPLEEAMSRSFWRTKRFRQGLVVIVMGIFALVLGEVGVVEWLKGNWTEIALVLGGLYAAFAGAGAARSEAMIDGVRIRQRDLQQQIADLHRDVNLQAPAAQAAKPRRRG